MLLNLSRVIFKYITALVTLRTKRTVFENNNNLEQTIRKTKKETDVATFLHTFILGLGKYILWMVSLLATRFILVSVVVRPLMMRKSFNSG